jgi:hypothetical protein
LVRISQRPKARRRHRELAGYFERKGVFLQHAITVDDQGRVKSDSLAYIDPILCRGDNGRVLGLDNRHGHHRHGIGIVEPVEFTTFAELEARFEAEFWDIDP